MRIRHSCTFACLALFVLAAPGFSAGLGANEAFEQLKSLAGTWHGEAAGSGAAAEAEAKAVADTGGVVHHFEVSAGGTVVMETMQPGTDHEMINMYHLDGEDLVLTHYCAGGNQPTMKLDRAASTTDVLQFDFTGGTNLDAAVDEHIHSARLTMKSDGGVESAWKAHAGGEEVGTMVFDLARQQ